MVILSSVVDYLRRAAAYRRTRRLLGEMDDRLLNDIGISRSEIDAIARRGFARRSVSPAETASRPSSPVSKLPKTTPHHA